ncbi:MAG: extracellular solute-binding protein, partial [candidate division Zixibacteria bacterium]|nr:extracellular solute-binding protein [candidate division Zixibacteria bacterium]
QKWEPAMLDSNVYGFPWILDTRVLFFNKKLVAQAGFNPNSFPATWAELLIAVRQIHNPKNRIYGFGANSAEKHRLYKKFLPFMWSNDGLILSSDGKECWLDSKQVREALEFYTELTKNGLIDTQRRLDEEFMAGKVGFVVSGGWLLQEIRKNKPDLDFGVCLMPKPNKTAGLSASFAGGEYLVINKNCRHPEQAMKLVRFLTDLDNSLEFCKSIGTPSPSHAMAALDPYYAGDPYLAVFQEQLNLAKSPPVHPQWVQIEEEIEKAVEQAMYQKKTPREALDQAKQNIDQLLKQ